MSRTSVAGLLAVPFVLVALGACGGGGGGADAGPDGGGKTTEVSEATYPQSVASGDPTDSSVVFWTRIDPGVVDGDATLSLVVATDEGLGQEVARQDVTAKVDYDHVAKVKVDGLDPATFYWYRFEYDDGSKILASRTGRTKTAPAPDADVPVRFATLNCQDYKDRWYNVHAHLVKQYENAPPADDLDFVVFLGDYIYETDGGTAPRAVAFQDTAGAIDLGGGQLAASSLANYRTLYETYRSDPMLQRLHERYPVIAIWDDHEFSDDSWDATATYFNGKVDERDVDRKRHAEQAFFEFLPIEAGLGSDGTLDIGPDVLYPNTKIYGDRRFGKNVEVMLTDYRTFRPDHLVPEDAFPGTIVLDETATSGAGIEPYVDLDAAENATLKAGLVPIVTAAYQAADDALDAAAAQARAEAALTGNVSARYLNGLLQAAGQSPAFDDAALAALPKGIAYLTMGKQDLFTQIGSRYALAQVPFYAYAQALAAARGGAADVFGAAQSTWLDGALTASDATWKVVTSSVSTAPILLDLTNPQIASVLPAGFPDALKVLLLMDADDWDGFPLAKEALLDRLSQVDGAVLVSGDIHATFVSDHGDRSSRPDGGTNRVFDFTGPSASSETWSQEVAAFAQALGITGIDPILAILPTLHTLSAESGPITQPSRLKYVNASQHGYVVLSADGSALGATYFLTDDVSNRHYDESFATLDGRFETKAFTVQDGALTEP